MPWRPQHVVTVTVDGARGTWLSRLLSAGPASPAALGAPGTLILGGGGDRVVGCVPASRLQGPGQGPRTHPTHDGSPSHAPTLGLAQPRVAAGLGTPGMSSGPTAFISFPPRSMEPWGPVCG